jgi:HSP20 family protein
MAVPAKRTQTVSPQPMRRWEPFREFEQLQEQMDQLMQSVLAPTGSGNGGVWIPHADIEETEDAWVIEAEVPGVDRKDVNVELRDSELIITGEIKEKERKGIIRRQTRRKGQFEYRVTLPGQTDQEHIEATIHDGVLTVRVPKSETAKRHQIEVKAA